VARFPVPLADAGRKVAIIERRVAAVPYVYKTAD
jgi:hypothetical protein